MTLFDSRALLPESIRLPSGRVVSIPKFGYTFRPWTSVRPKPTHNNKSYLEWEGKPTFAEIALISILKQDGYTGAVWRDNWAHYNCFRDAMPDAKCELPEPLRDVCSRIRARLGHYDWAGCWDVLAWNEKGVKFIECKKGKTSDALNDNQIRWLEAALQEGLTENTFAICEWTFERGV